MQLMKKERCEWIVNWSTLISARDPAANHSVLSTLADKPVCLSWGFSIRHERGAVCLTGAMHYDLPVLTTETVMPKTIDEYEQCKESS